MKVRRSRLIKVQRIPEAGRSVGGGGGERCRGVEYNLDVQEAFQKCREVFQSAGLGRPRGRRGDPQAKVQEERKPMAGSGAWQDAGAGHKL